MKHETKRKLQLAVALLFSYLVILAAVWLIFKNAKRYVH